MTTARLRVALNASGLFVLPLPEERADYEGMRAEAILTPRGSGFRLELLVGRKLSKGVLAGWAMPRKGMQGTEFGFFFGAEKRGFYRELPRFSCHEVEFDLEEGDGYSALTWALPLLHELPWPRCTGGDSGSVAEAAIAELGIRSRSAVAAKVTPKDFARTVPEWARKSISPQTWMTLMGVFAQ